MRHSSIFLSLVLVLAASALAGAAGGTTVSVGIFSGRHVSACSFTSQSALEVQLSSEVAPTVVPAGATVTLRAAGDAVRFTPPGGQTGEAASCTLSSEDPVQVALEKAKPRSYRGTITVASRDGVLMLVNRLPLDDYLRGVVPAEMPAKFAPEALKAQAIAARTYTLVHLQRHAAAGYDLCDGVHCQVYLGAGCEDRRVNAAIEATAGEIVTYQGRPIQAVYHDTCGGETAGNDEAWTTKTQTPYLRPVDDSCDGVPFCAASPKAQWTRTLSQARLAAALAKYGVTAPLALIQPVGCEDGTRPDRYRFVGRAGDWAVPAGALREAVNHALGADSMPSADFVADVAGDTITFTGWGNGHGVGLCQWGANGMAKQGKTAPEILAHYYAGTQVQSLATAIAAR